MNWLNLIFTLFIISGITLFSSLAATKDLSHVYNLKNSLIEISPSYKNHSSRLNSISFKTEQYYEIISDDNNDGRIDRRELWNDNLRIVQSLPFQGDYHHMIVEKTVKDKKLILWMYLQPKQREYVLYHYEWKPLAKLKKESVTPESGKTTKNTPEQLSDKLTSTSSSELKKDLESFLLIDHSCSSEPFKKYYQDILSGITQVLQSNTNNSSRYLACLEKNGMTSYAKKFRTLIADSLWNPNKTENNETVQDTKVSCNQTNDNTLGTFDQTTNKISFHALPETGNTSGSSVDYFAQVFFHEGIHMSGIDDESWTHDIEECCTQTDPNKTECGNVLTKVQDEKKREAQIVATFTNLKGFEPVWQELINKGNATIAKYFFTSYSDAIDEAITKARANCQGDSANCAAQFRAELTLAENSFFDRMCPYYYKENDCDKFASEFSNLRQENMISMCDNPIAGQKDTNGKVQPEQINCLRASRLAAKQLLEGDGSIDSAWTKFNTDENKLLQSYLDSFVASMEGAQDIWYQLQTKIGPDRTKAILNDLLTLLQTSSAETDVSFSRCVEKKIGKNICAKKATSELNRKLKSYFAKSCPRYYAKEINNTDTVGADPYTEWNTKCISATNDIIDFINDNISNKCQMTGGTTKYNSTCLLSSLKDGKDIYCNYNSLFKDGKFIGTTQSKLYDCETHAELGAGRVQELINKINSAESKANVSRLADIFRPVEATTELNNASRIDATDSFLKGKGSTYVSHMIHLDPKKTSDLTPLLKRRHSTTLSFLKKTANKVNEFANFVLPQAEAKTNVQTTRNQSLPTSNNISASSPNHNITPSTSRSGHPSNDIQSPSSVASTSQNNNHSSKRSPASFNSPNVESQLKLPASAPMKFSDLDKNKQPLNSPQSISQKQKSGLRTPAKTNEQIGGEPVKPIPSVFATSEELIRYIQRNGRNTTALQQPWFQNELLAHEVQLIDEQSRTFGPAKARFKLKFSNSQSLFVPTE